VPYGIVYSCLEKLLEKGLITEKKEIIKDRTISYYRLAG